MRRVPEIRPELSLPSSLLPNRLWLHLDVDVLNHQLMPAVDYREPGGLTWREVEYVLAVASHTDRLVGLEVTIYNPTLDAPCAPLAAQIVHLLAAGLSVG